MNMFGIRNKATGEVVETFGLPILAEQEIQRLKEAEEMPTKSGKKAKAKPEYEIVERTINNVYHQFPDGRTYIVGTETVWQPYEVEKK